MKMKTHKLATNIFFQSYMRYHSNYFHIIILLLLMLLLLLLFLCGCWCRCSNLID